MPFQRHPLNPLITPQQIKPSRSSFEVVGAFNAGAVQFNGETLLLVRVAERLADRDPDWIVCPYLDSNNELAVFRVRRNDPDYETGDSRFLKHAATGAVYLTSISHLRLARSTDGIHFTMDERPWLEAFNPYGAYGVEDARITCIEGTYLVNFTAVSQHGIATTLIQTPDFERAEYKGVIFPPSNRDVALFPQRINGEYYCYHRPMPGEFGKYSIWLAKSPDLIHWGGHQLVLEGSASNWDSGRVGGGAPPLWTEAGWLSIYHAADRQHRYCLGAFLSAHDDPARVLYRSPTPIFQPEADYETSGFFKNVVFTCGVLQVDGMLRMYYGASDDIVALAEIPLSEILDQLKQTRR